MAKHITVEAIRRLDRSDDNERLEIAADLLNLYQRAMRLGGRQEFTGQDLKTFNLACLVLDNVAGSVPADTPAAVGEELERAIAASAATLREQSAA